MKHSYIIWLTFFFLFLHNVEEIWAFQHLKYYSFLSPIDFSVEQLVFSETIVTLLTLALTIFVGCKSNDFQAIGAIVGFNCYLLISALFTHILLAGLTGSYVPGLVTAICLFLPFSLFVLNKYSRYFIDRQMFYRTCLFGLSLGFLVVILSDYISMTYIS
jgi:hypothetical protein